MLYKSFYISCLGGSGLRGIQQYFFKLARKDSSWFIMIQHAGCFGTDNIRIIWVIRVSISTSIYRGAFPAMFDIVWLLKSIFWSRDIQWIYASDCYLAMYTTAMESKDKSSYRCWKFSPALLCCYMLHMLLYMSFFMLHQFGPGRTVSCIGSRSHATFPEEFVP